jgi:uncharacterized membrane protein required for colicin V production
VSFVDILLLLVIIGITATGFFNGTIHLLIAVVSFYASIVLSSLYFRFLAVFFTRRGTSEVVADSLSFFVILVLCFIILFVSGTYTFRYVRFPGRLDYLDRMLGVIAGLVLASMVAVIIAIVFHFAFIRHNVAATANFPLTRTFQTSVQRSTLVPLLIEHVLPRLYVTVGPLLPDAAQPFFRPGR